MSSKRTVLAGLLALVIALFAAGVVWRALHPASKHQPSAAATLASRQDGYYLCLHRARMSTTRMRALIARRLPGDVAPAALRGCREAQRRP